MDWKNFLKCGECGFKFTMLTPTNIDLEEIDVCPHCGDSELDYMPNAERKEYIQELRKELIKAERYGIV